MCVQRRYMKEKTQDTISGNVAKWADGRHADSGDKNIAKMHDERSGDKNIAIMHDERSGDKNIAKGGNRHEMPG